MQKRQKSKLMADLEVTNYQFGPSLIYIKIVDGMFSTWSKILLQLFVASANLYQEDSVYSSLMRSIKFSTE